MSKQCSYCTSQNRSCARFCKVCGDQFANEEPEPMTDLIGMQDIRQRVTQLCSAMEAVRLDGQLYGDRMHTIIIGNSGSGKTKLVHEIAALLHKHGITKSVTPIVYDAVDYSEFSKNIQDNYKKAKGHVLCIENVQKLIPAGYSESVEPIDKLISEMSRPDNKVDPIIFLSGQPQRLREYLDANDSVCGKFPYIFKLADYIPSELVDLTEVELKKSGFVLDATARQKLLGVFKLLLKNAKLPDSEPEARNAWMAIKMAENLKLTYFSDAASNRKGNRLISEGLITYETDEEKTLEQIFDELDNYIGMHRLKKAIRGLVDEISVQRKRAENGLISDNVAFHIVLTGNPGTGKTSIARVLGEVLRAIGILDLGHVIEADRGKMVAEHVGGTAPMVHKLCDRAMGGILFIDEAYTLKQGKNDTFGQEAIDALLKRMEDDRGKFVVIIAGYPLEIEKMLNSNPGLQSRFKEDYRFHFDDYTAEELASIFMIMADKKGYKLDGDAKEKALRHFTLICAQKDKNFSNARIARDLFEACKTRHGIRLNSKPGQGEPSAMELALIRECDMPVINEQVNDMTDAFSELDKMIGLYEVKRQVRVILSLLKAEKARGKHGFREMQHLPHFVFKGPPGTGKTTVAKILASSFKRIGLLPKGHLVEVDRSGLVSAVLGGTEEKANSAIDDAIGGVLFIDEAYGLVGDQFGSTAIDVLVKRMDSDRNKFIVIVAGYEREMDEFLSSNTGLRSRFTKYIDFCDYSSNEMLDIYKYFVADNGFILDKSAEEHLAKLLDEIYVNRDETFGNGRTVRNIFEATKENQAVRIEPVLAEGGTDRAELITITLDDIPAQW